MNARPYELVKIDRLWWGIVSLEQDLRLDQNGSPEANERAKELIVRYRKMLAELCEKHDVSFYEVMGYNPPAIESAVD